MMVRMAHRAPRAFAVGVIAMILTGCAANELGDIPSDLRGTIDGAGSSAQASAQEVWVAGFQHANASVTVNYDPTGSGAGREAFLGGGADFAGSDSALSDEELSGEFGSCAPGSLAIDLPLYVSPIAIVFNVQGVDELDLTADAVAAIFKGDIARWNDPVLRELNPGATLPDEPITAVHRADDSGTTKNFVDYLHAAAPTIWDAEPDDRFPYSGGEAAQGNSGVVSAVSNGTNTIGYADASKAQGLDIARLAVGDAFVAPSPEAAARIVELSPRATGRSEHDIVIDIDRTSEAESVYPLVLVSYVIACEAYEDANTADLVKAYLSYIASEDGQQASADAAGSSPITASLAEEVRDAIDSIR